MRIAFMGTPDFALPTLKALVASDHKVVAVYSQPPARAGRGKKERPSPVHAWAESQNIPVYTPVSMREASAQEAFRALDLDMAVVVAYGQILPQSVLDTPKHGCVNVHASLLPRWRGAAPIHRAVIAGDNRTGVCIMQMEAGLDTGPVLKKAETEIGPTDTTLSLHDRLAAMGGDLIVPAIEGFANGNIIPVAQANDGVTYAYKIDKAEAKIDWSEGAEAVDRKVRGLYPFPGAWTMALGERFKLLAGSVLDRPGEAGEALDSQLTIGCGNNSYRIDRAQRAGKSIMDREELLRGFEVPAGTRFE